jgi:hypothetical protein
VRFLIEEIRKQNQIALIFPAFDFLCPRLRGLEAAAGLRPISGGSP